MAEMEQRHIDAGNDIDLKLLRRFVVVAEERNFGRAAARLHMTQPPLSRAIKQLETDVGAVLLDRSSTPVTLTSAGTALYDEARLLLEQADHVRTVHECIQAVLWNGTIGMAPLRHELPDGLVAVPVADMPPSRLIIAWNSTSVNPLIRSFTHIAAGIYRPA